MKIYLVLLITLCPFLVDAQWLTKVPIAFNNANFNLSTSVLTATTSDGNILVATRARDSLRGSTKTVLLKYNANNGQAIWQKTFDYLPTNVSGVMDITGTFPSGLIALPNGNIYLALNTGRYETQYFTNYSRKMLQLNSSGTIEKDFTQTLDQFRNLPAFITFQDLAFYDNTIWARAITTSVGDTVVRFDTNLSKYSPIAKGNRYLGGTFFIKDSLLYLNKIGLDSSGRGQWALVGYNLKGDSLKIIAPISYAIVNRGDNFFDVLLFGSTTALSYPNFYKLNNQFQRSWSYRYENLLPPSASNWQINFSYTHGHTIDEDGNIYVWGLMNNKCCELPRYASINKISKNGSITWQYNYNTEYINMTRVLSLSTIGNTAVAVGDDFAGGLWITKLNPWGLLNSNKDLNNPNTFQLYPNPASDNITLDFKIPLSGSLRLFASNGQVVRQMVMQDLQTVNISISDLPTGLYTVHVFNRATNQNQSLKFIKTSF
jgi:Secretion system C-terminal sorting domain